MKKLIKNRMILNTIILTMYTFVIEMIIRYFMNVSILDFASVRILISSLIIAMIISFITHLMPKLVARIINIIYIIVTSIVCFAELGLHNYLGFFMGFGNADQGTKVLSYLIDFFYSLSIIHYLFFIPMIFFIVYYIVFDRKIAKVTTNNNTQTLVHKICVEVITIIFITGVSFGYYEIVKNNVKQNDLQTETNYAVWLYPENSNLSVNNYGVLVYLFTDIKAKVLNITVEDVIKLTTDASKENTDNKDKEEIADFSRVIDDSAWNTLIENTSDSTFNTLNEFFINREITDKNEYTGIFEGKNLIIILMESVNEIPIYNKEYFPTINKIYHEGISFKNNFSPRNNCPTGNNEFTAMTSLFTINDTCTANGYKNNKYFEAVFNKFKENGYYASSYHNYTQKYYYRNKIHTNMGSEKFYGVTDLEIPYDPKYGEWPSDVELFKNSQKYYMDKDKFMSYFATVSTHHPYIVPSVLGDKYMDYFIKEGYSKELSRYLSKMKTLDEALEELLQELEETGKLDDTVIALFGDHYPYGLKDSQINEFLTRNNASYVVDRQKKTSIMDVDRTPLVIYNSQAEPVIVEDYTTMIDLLPTLLNMFNIDYDPRLYLGTDVFSKSHESRAIFADGSWQNEYAYYYAPNSKITYFVDDYEYDITELKKINQDIITRQKMSALAIKSDYFNYLGEGLAKYKVSQGD